MEAKLDRRVRRTRKQLREALIELILENGYDSITVQDITDRADLSRATFYLHYRDKEELLLLSLEAIYDDLVERIGEITQERLTSGEPPSLVAFQHAAENRDLYRILLDGQGSGVIHQRVRAYLAAVIRERVKALLPADATPIPLDILAQHMAGSLLGLLAWWLENETPHSAEYMAETYRQLYAPLFLRPS